MKKSFKSLEGFLEVSPKVIMEEFLKKKMHGEALWEFPIEFLKKNPEGVPEWVWKGNFLEFMENLWRNQWNNPLEIIFFDIISFKRKQEILEVIVGRISKRFLVGFFGEILDEKCEHSLQKFSNESLEQFLEESRE